MKSFSFVADIEIDDHRPAEREAVFLVSPVCLPGAFGCGLRATRSVPEHPPWKSLPLDLVAAMAADPTRPNPAL